MSRKKDWSSLFKIVVVAVAEEEEEETRVALFLARELERERKRERERERESIMRYVTIKVPKTPKDFYFPSSSFLKEEGKEEDNDGEERVYEEIPPDKLEEARIGLYVPEKKKEPMEYVSRAAKEKCAIIERQGFAKEYFERGGGGKEEEKVDEKSMLLGKTELKMKAMTSGGEMFPGENVLVEKTTRAMERRRKEVFRELELPCITRMQNTVQNIFEEETRRFERDLKRDESGENEEDDDDEDHDGKIGSRALRRQTHFFSRAEREQLYELPAGTLAKLDCVENLLQTIHVHPPAQREFDCFAGGAGMREKAKNRAFLELPVLVDEPRRTFLECVWPICDEERKAIKVSDVSEESKFCLLSEDEKTRAPLFKTSKIEDIDAYVENRKMVVKTSTLPSFMLPVEENYPIRHNNAVTEDINPNPAPLSRSPERPLLPGTVTTEGDFQSPIRAVQQQHQKQIIISPRFLAVNFQEGEEMVQDSVDFYKSNMNEEKTKKTTTTTDVPLDGSGSKNIASASRPKTPGTVAKHHLQTKLNFASPRTAMQKRENEKQPEIEFSAFRLPEHPHGFAIETIAHEYYTVRERIPVHFDSAVPTFDARIDYDLYVSRMEKAEERERQAGHIDTAANWRRLKDLLSVAYFLEAYGVTVANLQLRCANNQMHTSSGTNNTIFIRTKSKAEEALEAAVSSVQRGESLDNPKLGGLQPLVRECRSDGSGRTKMLVVVPELKAIGPIVKYIHSIGGRVNCLPSKKFLHDGQSEQEERLFVAEVRRIVSKHNLDALIVLEQHFIRASFPVSDFSIVVFYAPSRNAENIVETAINAKRFRGIERNGAIKIFKTDVVMSTCTSQRDQTLRTKDEFKMPQSNIDWEEDKKNVREYIDDDILGFDDIIPVDKSTADVSEHATLNGVKQTKLVVLQGKHSSSMIDRIEVKVQQSNLARVIRRRLFDRIADPNVKEIYARIISLITTKDGVRAICLFRMRDTLEIQSGDLQEVFFLASRCAKVLSRSFYWTEFIFEIDPEYLDAREAESFVSELRYQVVKDEIDIDVTFSPKHNIIDAVFKAITFEAATATPCNEDKMQSNDDCFPYLAEKNFAFLPSESSSVWEIALNDLFPYVNAITILVLIEHGLEVDKVVRERKLTREDYETCQRLCGCPMKAFQSIEEEANDEEDIHEAMPGEYDNNLFDEDDDEDPLLFKRNDTRKNKSDIMTSRWQDAVQARKACRTGLLDDGDEFKLRKQTTAVENMRSPLQSPMHSKSPHQQQKQERFSNQDMHFMPQTRPPPRFDKTLGIGTFMGSPSSPSSMKTGARGGDDAEEFYIDPRDGASVPKNTTLSKHQQGREAVLRMMSKQKKRGGSTNAPNYYQRSIASPTKITSEAPPKGEFFAFHEHFRPEAYHSDTVGFGRKNKKKEPRTQVATGARGDGGFPNFHWKEKEVKDIDDEFPVSPYYYNSKMRGRGQN